LSNQIKFFSLSNGFLLKTLSLNDLWPADFKFSDDYYFFLYKYSIVIINRDTMEKERTIIEDKEILQFLISKTRVFYIF
jgi:hypothetical protein